MARAAQDRAGSPRRPVFIDADSDGSRWSRGFETAGEARRGALRASLTGRCYDHIEAQEGDP